MHAACVPGAPLSAYYAHVFAFTWEALHGIEDTLFLPWLRTVLPCEDAPVLDEFAARRGALRAEARVLETRCRSGDAAAAADTLAGMIEQHRALRDAQEAYLVPRVAAAVDASAQEKFNTKVVRYLGVLNSRKHLVSFDLAIDESGSAQDRADFDRQVPAVMRWALPRWRRTIYPEFLR